MFVPVVLKDGKEELVGKDELQYLIVTEQLLFFKRSDGWVVPGRDKMRHENILYSGEERRQHDVFAQNH